MAKRKSSGVEMDLSSFMAVLIMTIGCMVVILVSNVIIIVSNPNNTRITSIITSSIYVEGMPDSKTEETLLPFPNGNQLKEPTYVDVHRDRLIIYPGESIVPVRDMRLEGNAFEKALNRVAANTANEYIILLLRPGTAPVARQLKKSIEQRGIDLGYELFEDERDVNYQQED